MQPLIDLQQEIPSNKFYAPRIDGSGNLFRSHLITETLASCVHSKKVIVIEAQAGQGKSTLAAQYLKHNDLRFAWYQIGPEDTDPVLLLSALIANFCKRLPGFKSPQLSQILHQGEIGPLDIKRCTNILLSDLDHFLAGDFFLVFDDVHLIENAPLTNSLLDHLIDTSPPRLHLLLTSRRPLVLSSRILRYSTDVCYLNNDNLRLSSSEVEHLFHKVLKKQISRKEAEQIQDRTGGWIMGILLAAYPMPGKNRSGPITRLTSTRLPASLSARQVLNYFRDEILIHVPDNQHTPLLQLSFLSEIPVDLAVRITGRDDMGTTLIDMVMDNFFVYPLDDAQTVFRFHHLFQEFLQYQARTTMDPDEISLVHRQAAAYYLEKGFTEKALTCYRAEGNLRAVEEILSREGLHLLARNRVVTLLTLLQSIPEQELMEHAWLALFAGLVFSEFFPKRILPLLETARERFASQGEETGELLALAHTIYFHFVVSGLYHPGSLLLQRADELFLKHRDQLPIHARIMVARNLAAGYCFFVADMEQAREYAEMTRRLSIKHDIRNCLASILFVCGYIESMTGHPKNSLQEIEQTNPLLHDPFVGTSNKLSIRVLHLNYLAQFGDFLNFERQQKLLRESIDPQVVQQTLAHPYRYIWGCAGLVGMGRQEKAAELLLQGIRISAPFETPHMHSQLLQWQAYIHALLGHADEARSDIRRARELRALAGGRFYEIFHEIIAGATCSRLGDHEQAEILLSSGISRARQMKSDYLLAAGLMHRAWLYLQKQKQPAMKQDLEQGLSLMQKNNFSFFWSWEPIFMEELLALARETRMANFADDLARKRLQIFYPDDSSRCPQLFISILGPFRICHGQQTLLTADDFTPAQRHLLSLLLASEGQQISQESIQLTFWPDSPPNKARSKLDTLLTRLRKVLAAALPVPVKHYLVMQRGILSLKNCRIDAVEFSRFARQGLALTREEKHWQADNSFHRAMSLWNGCPGADNFFSNRMEEYCDQLLALLSRAGYTWAVNLAESERTDEAIAVLTKVLQFNRKEDRLITMQYGLYLRTGNMLKAKDLLKQYRQALRDQEYTDEKIDDLLFKVASSVQ